GGQTSNLHTLGHNERKQFLEWVVRESGGLPVWVDVTASTTAGATDLCQHGSRHGARGALLCPPHIGRYFAHEAKAMTTAVNRHGNMVAEFADPEGKWADFGELALKAVRGVEPGMAVLERAAPDECLLGSLVVSPFAMFGADKAAGLVAKIEVFRPAMQSLLRHGGMNRAS